MIRDIPSIALQAAINSARSPSEGVVAFIRSGEEISNADRKIMASILELIINPPTTGPRRGRPKTDYWQDPDYVAEWHTQFLIREWKRENRAKRCPADIKDTLIEEAAEFVESMHKWGPGRITVDRERIHAIMRESQERKLPSP